MSFRYGEGKPWIRKRASMRIKAGESGTVMGASGAGKTMLPKIALALLKPTKGEVLSGGKQQRLLPARALHKQLRVLALDEATSHRDLANERAVTAAIAHMQLTRLVIVHPPETIAGAQRVVQVKDGQVVEVARAMPPAPRPAQESDAVPA